MAAGNDLMLAAEALRKSLSSVQELTKQAVDLCDACSSQIRSLERGSRNLINKAAPLQQAAANIRQAQAQAGEVLEHLDASRKVQGVIRAGPHADLDYFLCALAQLEAALDFLQRHRSMQAAASALAHTTQLRDDALAQVNAEFSAQLRQLASLLPPSAAATAAAPPQRSAAGARERIGSVKDNAAVIAAAAAAAEAADKAQEPALARLRLLAEVLMRSDARGCMGSYVQVRRGMVAKALDRHLVQLSSREEVLRLSWELLESRVPGWCTALQLFARLVQQEAKLSVAVFRQQEQAAAALAQAVEPAASALLEAAGAVLDARRAPEKVFSLLDMHQTIESTLPTLCASCSGGSLQRASVALARVSPGPQGSAGVPAQLAAIGELSALQGRLVAEAGACFDGLQQAWGPEAGSAAPADGTVHPLCASTVSTLKRILGADTALPVLFGEDAGQGSRGAGLQQEARLLERMTAAVTRVLDALLTGLETRARSAYKSPAQAALHMANNAQFLAKAIEGSRELRSVSEGWWDRHKGKAEQYAKQYEELATAPVLSLLRSDLEQPAPTNVASDKLARQACKDRWLAVNKALAELAAQAGWAVPDAGLRYSIKDALAEAVLPLYERLHSKYSSIPFTEQRSKYVRWSPSDLSAALQQMFEAGAADSVAARMTAAPNVQRSTSSLSRAVSSMRRVAR